MSTVKVSCFEVMSSNLQRGEVLLSAVCLKMRPTHDSNIHIPFTGLWQLINLPTRSKNQYVNVKANTDNQNVF